MTFNQFSNLPQNLIMTESQVIQYSGHFVDLKEPKTFRRDQFLDSVNNYKGDDLTFSKHQNKTINQQFATVSTMVEKIVEFLRNVLSIALSDEDINTLTRNIEITFMNLKEAKEHGWADFFTSSSSSNSSWEYRVLFAFPNPDLPDSFYSLVTIIKFQADIEEESVWWGISSVTRKNFAATINAMELVVLRGFADPLKA